MSEEKKRLRWLDCAKGVAILLVVLGHSVTSAIRADSQIAFTIFDCVYFMHMPLFMFLSGLSYRIADKKYRDYSVKKFFIGKTKNLLLPYAVYATIVFLIFVGANMLPKIGDMMKNAGYGPISVGAWLKGLLIGDNVYCVHVWYIYVLFLFTMATFLARKYLPRIADVLLPVVAVVLLFVRWYTGQPDTEAYSNLCNWAIWFWLGTRLNMDKVKGGVGCLLFAVGVILFWVNYLGVLPFGSLPYGFWLELPIKFCIVIGLTSMIKAVCTVGNRGLEYLGTHSMEIYLFHQPFWGSCFGSVFYGVLHLPMALVICASVVLSVTVPLVIGYCLRKTKKLKVLFGLK